jgi:hypothetical protein
VDSTTGFAAQRSRRSQAPADRDPERCRQAERISNRPRRKRNKLRRTAGECSRDRAVYEVGPVETTQVITTTFP